jgi:hypothetical protein
MIGKMTVFENLTQRRKGAKKASPMGFSEPLRLCAFA